MILLYSLFFILGLLAFFSLSKLGLGKRLIVATLIFSIPSVIMTVVLIIGGDKPTAGARTITLEELNREGDE